MPPFKDHEKCEKLNKNSLRPLHAVNVGFPFKLKSFSHNVKLVRRILFEWARDQIRIDGEECWNECAKILPKKPGLENVNLLMDSCDFRRSGKQSTSRKNPSWSYKVNGPGQ